MTNNPDCLRDLKQLETRVNMGNGSFSDAVSEGIIVGTNLRALYVPNLKGSILSLSEVMQQAGRCTFTTERVWIDTEAGRIEGVRHGNLYFADLKKGDLTRELASIAKTMPDWHSRLGHPGNEPLRKLGYSVPADPSATCEACVLGKSTRRPLNRPSPSDQAKVASRVGERIHVDLCGPVQEHGVVYQYVLVLVDDYSRWTEVHFLQSKGEAAGRVKEYIVKNKRQENWVTKRLRSDNGGEFVNSDLEEFILAEGIIHERTTPYTPQHNGVVERTNRSLFAKARCLLSGCNLTSQFWTYAVQAACYLLNRLPRESLSWTSPYLRRFKKTPFLDHIRIFGCLCYAAILPRKDKLSNRTSQGILLGYNPNGPGYQIWLLNDEKVIVSRDVTFDETKFPSVGQEKIDDHQNDFAAYPQRETSSDHAMPTSFFEDQQPDIIFEDDDSYAGENHHNEENAESDGEDTNQSSRSDEMLDEDAEVMPDREDVSLRRSTRQRFLPKGIWSRGWTTDDASANAATTSPTECIPASYAQAVEDVNAEHWRQAMDEEISAIAKNQTWTLVEPPPGKSIVGSRWVFAKKSDPERYKARLVAQGFSQRPGQDYGETYAPVVTLSSIRLVLALGLKHRMTIHQMDVKTAFLYGKLDEDIYMKPPQGVLRSGDRRVCKLHKSLYGLKQSPRVWNTEINDFLLSIGLSRTSSDLGLYVERGYGRLTLICLYVDDLIIASTDQSRLDEIKQLLSDRYEMKDLGVVKTILGLQVQWRETKAVLHQEKFTRSILEDFGMANANSCKSPMEPGLQLPSLDEDYAEVESGRYRSLVGKLLYLANGTRPDISYSVGYLARFSSKPGRQHWAAAKRLLRYLNLRPGTGIILEPTDGETQVKCYSDADWAGDKVDRKSTSGCVVYVDGVPVQWSSRKQNVVALSTMEAEYIALAYACQETTWVTKVIQDLTGELLIPTIAVDNQPALDFARNGNIHARSKHIDIRYHFIKDLIIGKLIRLKHVSSKDMIGDIFTKALCGVRHQDLCETLGTGDEGEN